MGLRYTEMEKGLLLMHSWGSRSPILLGRDTKVVTPFTESYHSAWK